MQLDYLDENRAADFSSLGVDVRPRDLDQFYTKKSVARDCIDLLTTFTDKHEESFTYVEPSAGQGVFLDMLPYPKIGIDLKPSSLRNDILISDFLDWVPSQSDKPWIVVGNPPFGKNASLALRFINHAATFGTIIAFILPRTFQKPQIMAKIDPRFKLGLEKELPLNAFEFSGKDYSVPTVFQIWIKSDVKREAHIRTTSHPDFTFESDPDNADFAFQRVGAAAGKVSVEGLTKSAQSHYFVRVKNQSRPIQKLLAGADWSKVKYRTAGNPSIAKSELISMYLELIS